MLLSIVACTGDVSAQGNSLTFRGLGTEHGLSQATALAIHQDADGFIWIATQDGVNRWDGSSVTRFLSSSETSRRDIAVDGFTTTLAEHVDGSLWAGTRSSGVYVLDRTGEIVAQLRVPEPVSEIAADANRVFAIDRYADGRMLVGSGSGLWVSGRDSGRLEAVARPAGVPDSAGVTALLTGADAIWVGYADGTLARSAVRDANLAVLDWAVTQLDAQPRDFALDPDGERVWVATLGGGLYAISVRDSALSIDRQIRGGGTASAPRAPTLPSDYVTSVLFDSDENLWVGTWNGLALRRPGSTRWEIYQRSRLDPRSLRSSEIISLLEDRDGVLWIGTANGVNSLSPHRRAFGLYTNFVGGEVAPIAAKTIHGSRDGHLWVGTTDSELLRIHVDTGRPETVLFLRDSAADLPLGGLYEIEPDGSGGWWIATLGAGLLHYAPGRPGYEQFRRADGLPADDLESVTRSRDGSLWIGTNRAGLVRFDGQRFEHITTLPDGRPLHEYVWPILEDGDGALWIGTLGGGLYRLSGDRASARRIVLDDDGGATVDRILTLARARDGALWIGTQGGGLFRHEPISGTTRRWTAVDGLPHNHVEAILEDEIGDIWVSTNGGLGRYSPSEDSWRTFDWADGLQSDRFFANAAWKDDGGRLYFGGERGVTSVEPARIREPHRKPEVLLTGVRVEGARNRMAETRDLVLRASENAVEFRFVTLDFENPDKNAFRYRLSDVEETWVEGARDWSARYTGLGPGGYTFEVQATNAAGVASDVLAVPFEVRPPFWGTIWFQVGIGISLVALTWIVYLYRTRQRLEIERVRFRIASRLHDDVGASLSGIAMRTEMLSRLKAEQVAPAKLLELSNAARRTATRLRETVWVVAAHHDTAAALRTRIEETSHELLNDICTYSFDSVGLTEDVRVGMELRQDLHLLTKEALHNSARHADADHVDIALRYDAKKGLGIRITDDGVGFDVRAAERRGGNGLGLMRRHAQRHGGTIRIESGHEGTSILVEVPRKKNLLERLTP
ncbi:MAG: ATP-binding protein [Gemmatimonadetes bacterium]|nr:ATP-binding protein [Gemmatimonadota bacterium]